MFLFGEKHFPFVNTKGSSPVFFPVCFSEHKRTVPVCFCVLSCVLFRTQKDRPRVFLMRQIPHHLNSGLYDFILKIILRRMQKRMLLRLSDIENGSGIFFV